MTFVARCLCSRSSGRKLPQQCQGMAHLQTNKNTGYRGSQNVTCLGKSNRILKRLCVFRLSSEMRRDYACTGRTDPSVPIWRAFVSALERPPGEASWRCISRTASAAGRGGRRRSLRFHVPGGPVSSIRRSYLGVKSTTLFQGSC